MSMSMPNGHVSMLCFRAARPSCTNMLHGHGHEHPHGHGHYMEMYMNTDIDMDTDTLYGHGHRTKDNKPLLSFYQRVSCKIWENLKNIKLDYRLYDDHRFWWVLPSLSWILSPRYTGNWPFFLLQEKNSNIDASALKTCDWKLTNWYTVDKIKNCVCNVFAACAKLILQTLFFILNLLKLVFFNLNDEGHLSFKRIPSSKY